MYIRAILQLVPLTKALVKIWVLLLTVPCSSRIKILSKCFQCYWRSCTEYSHFRCTFPCLETFGLGFVVLHPFVRHCLRRFSKHFKLFVYCTTCSCFPTYRIWLYNWLTQAQLKCFNQVKQLICIFPCQVCPHKA